MSLIRRLLRIALVLDEQGAQTGTRQASRHHALAATDLDRGQSPVVRQQRDKLGDIRM